MKNKYLFLFTFMVAAAAFGQQKSRADRFFAKGDYEDAAKYYVADYEKTNAKSDLLGVIDSYYNVMDYKNAGRYLTLLVNERYTDSISGYDNSYNFKLYQTLNASGNTTEALDYLERYNANRGVAFDKAKAAERMATMQAMSPSFEIKKADFNSDASEFGAVRREDVVYFVSDRFDNGFLDLVFAKRFKWTQRAFLDIYKVQVNEKNDSTSTTLQAQEAINSKLHDGSFCFNSKGDEMFLSRSAYAEGDSKKQFDEDATNHVHLYKSVRIDGIWRPVEKLSFVQEGYSYLHPSLTRDGKRLYFASDMPGGQGGYDLYYVTVNLDGTYGTPVNLGTKINTPHREQFPHVSDQGDLYFSSNGHLGLGMMDIFVSPLTVKGFTAPINLGAPINSPYDDFSISYYDAEHGFIATNRNGLDDDIYSFTQTAPVITRDFRNMFELRDAETKDFITDGTVQILGYQGKEVFKETNESPTIVVAKLPVDDYTFIGYGENYKEDRMPISIEGSREKPYVLYLERIYTDTELALIKEKNLPKDLKEKDPSRFELLTDAQAPQVVEKEGKLFIDVAPIYFDFDLWNIREDSQVVLDELANKLIKYPRIKINIESHTDSRGPAEYNMPLSERRAKATFDYLIEKGIDPSRITYKGYGDTKPVVECPAGQCTEAEHQLNRRSEFEITGY